MSGLVDRLWEQQNKHPGDREALFQAVADHVEIRDVLYPGSFVDLAASFVFDDVTYVDIDRRSFRFFTDTAGVDRIIADNRNGSLSWRFIHADFNDDLPVEEGSADLLVSLYAGLISDPCARYLKIGGHLLANTSHGDVALASLDPRYELEGVVVKADSGYRLRSDDLDGFLTPKRGEPPTEDRIRTTGRGIAYEKQAAAYLFQRIS